MLTLQATKSYIGFIVITTKAVCCSVDALSLGFAILLPHNKFEI